MQFKAANVQSSAVATTENQAVSKGKLVPQANPFTKKRQFEEITNTSAPAKTTTANAAADQNNDVDMQREEEKSAPSDVYMQSA